MREAAAILSGGLPGRGLDNESAGRAGRRRCMDGNPSNRLWLGETGRWRRTGTRDTFPGHSRNFHRPGMNGIIAYHDPAPPPGVARHPRQRAPKAKRKQAMGQARNAVAGLRAGFPRFHAGAVESRTTSEGR